MTLIGTSGDNYKEWKGPFYPADLPASKMLAFYSDQFPTVEINYSFYRIPSEKVIADWVTATPDSFTFTLKAPRRITHDARLEPEAGLLETFLDRARALGDKLGVLLFQLPPSFRADLDVFDKFLDWLPPGIRIAFEFRNASWFTDDVYDRMRSRNLALCVTDNEKSTTPDVVTADFGYFRLRDEGYAPDDISRWADLVRERQSGPWKQAFVYFKHEDEGKGPEFARALTAHLSA
jgi:uncharacterized protein YecE (DUF72 family)